MRVLSVMLSNGIQNFLSNGREQLPYSQNVDLSIADQFANLTPAAQRNQMFIRIASNDFFSASRDVVQKMITGEYNTQKAYEAFDAQLRESKDVSYAFRCFLLRLGFIGTEHKQTRKILLRNLTGSSAFKDGQPKEVESCE